MKKIVAIAMIAATLTMVGCSDTGVSQEKYDALQEAYESVAAERDALLPYRPSEKAESTNGTEPAGKVETTTEVEPVETQKQETESTVVTGEFDADLVASQLEVTEYFCDGKWYDYTFLAIKNNSDFNLSISVAVKFFNGNGELIGAETRDQEAFESGTDTLLMFSPDEKYATLEYEVSVSEEDLYECVVSKLSYESTTAKNKEIVSVTNNGSIPAEFVECYVLFFKDGKVVDYDKTYFTDGDYELKPGKTITNELDCSQKYDNVLFFLTGRAY